MAVVVVCRDSVPLTLPQAALERLDDNSPLRHILLGTSHGLESSSSLDVAPEVLQLALLWGGSGDDNATSTAVARVALQRLAPELLDEAASFGDYVCLPRMRAAVQKQMLRAKITVARDARLTDRCSEGADVIPGLVAFASSAREFTVMQGLGPQEQAVVRDQARCAPAASRPNTHELTLKIAARLAAGSWSFRSSPSAASSLARWSSPSVACASTSRSSRGAMHQGQRALPSTVGVEGGGIRAEPKEVGDTRLAWMAACDQPRTVGVNGE